MTQQADNLLALARQAMVAGELEAAQARCLEVLGTQRHHPEALQLLGQILYSQGRHAEAVRVFNALTLMQPTVAGHWQNLGTALRPTQRHEQALAAFEHALQLAPPSAGLLYNLGMLQMDRCDYAAAYSALRDAAALAPTDATIRWAYAQCCYEASLVEEALQALQNWERLEGLSIDITVRILLLLVAMGATDPVRDILERLRANPPRQGRAAIAFASILERLNHLDEARATAQVAVLNDPNLKADPEWLLISAVLADRSRQHAEAYQYLTSALQNHRGFLHRHTLLFALARTCDALGRYEEAYSAAEEAHRSQLALVQAVTGRSSAQDSQTWSLTSSGCEPGDIASWQSSRVSREESPIFIVGFPRSGTTLLEQVLDAHPLLQSLDEQPLLLRALDEVTGSGVRYPAELGKLTEDRLEAIRAQYWERARRRGLLENRRLVDKNPLNLVLLPLIQRLFPQASVILALRHPCDTLLSCFLQEFRAPGVALLCTDLSTLARVYARVFNFWYSQCELLAPHCYELCYEQLVADFPAEVRKLIQFLDLPWHEALLEPGQHARARGFISTPSYAQVIEPVTDRSVGRWKHYERHFAGVMPVLLPWIKKAAGSRPPQ